MSEKAKATEKAATKSVEKKVRVKKDGPKIVQLELSTEGNANIKQTVSHVRYVGVLVTTTLLGAKGEAIGVSTQWIPGLKPKSKAGVRSLVQDKGPKPKKEKAAKKK
jgi:hypothetical protein